MSWRLPKKLEWPWGYEVTVEVVERAACEGDHGEWDAEKRVIYIVSDLTPAEKRGTLLHERDHAETDFKLWAAQNVPIKYPEGEEQEPEDDAE